MKKNILLLLVLSGLLSSCAELETLAVRSAKETATNLASRTTRTVQNKVETKVGQTIDKAGNKIENAFKTKTVTDSTKTK